MESHIQTYFDSKTQLRVCQKGKAILLKVHLLWLICLLCVAGYAQPLTQLQLPPRPVGAMTGTQFKYSILTAPLAMREERIFTEVSRGNVPDFFRVLQPVTTTATIASVTHTGTIYVLPDYMAIGSNEDYFFIPMTPVLAQKVVDVAQGILPTRKMVDAIAESAACKLAPSPIPPGPEMITVPVFWDHNVTLRAERAKDSAPPGALVRGGKKDVVISPRLRAFSDFDRVAIYGWHRLNNEPIQPLYFGHESTYADYSHGVRLVGKRMVLDGAEVDVADVLTSGAVGEVLNDEAVPFTSVAPARYNP